MMSARIDYSYRDKVYFAGDNDPFSVMPGYSLLNASVAWNSASDRYGLTLHAMNITDERIILYTEASGSSGTQNDILARDFAWYLTERFVSEALILRCQRLCTKPTDGRPGARFWFLWW